MKQVTFDTYTYDELYVLDKFQVLDDYFGYFDLEEEKQKLSFEIMWLKDSEKYLNDQLSEEIIMNFVDRHDKIFCEHFADRIFYRDGERYSEFRIW